MGQSALLESCAPRVVRPCISSLPSVGSVDGWSFSLADIDLTDYVLGYDLPISGTVAALRITCLTGSAVVTVLINNIAVEGLDHIPVTAGARAEFSAIGKNKFSPGDDITLRIESASGTVANLRGTIVTADKSVARQYDIDELPNGLVTGQLGITPDMAGSDTIELTLVPALLKVPTSILMPLFMKTAPTEDNIFCVSVDSIKLNLDGTVSGWNYNLSSQAIQGQVMYYGYLK